MCYQTVKRLEPIQLDPSPCIQTLTSSPCLIKPVSSLFYTLFPIQLLSHRSSSPTTTSTLCIKCLWLDNYQSSRLIPTIRPLPVLAYSICQINSPHLVLQRSQRSQKRNLNLLLNLHVIIPFNGITRHLVYTMCHNC